MDRRFDVRRRTLLRTGALAGGLSLLTPSLRARAATPALTMGLLRNPVAGMVDLGVQKGWFKEAGLDLGTVLFAGAGGPKVIQAMGGGSVSIGTVSATAALLAIAANAVPLQIVSIATDPAPLFVLQSAPAITTVPQLAGKRVATTAGTGLHYFLVRALAKFGMRQSDIEFVNLPVGDAQAAFLAQRVDAVVPSLAGRFYIASLRPDTRELFTHAMFTAAPGPTTPFEDYDVFIASQSAVTGQKAALQQFLSVFHGRCVPYLHDPKTQADAVGAITRYINVEQKSPTDALAVREQLTRSGFFDVREARKIMDGAAFRAGLEDQIRFLGDNTLLKGHIALDQVIAHGLV
jgi:ABC-type nitrate/sulfonate/bicarbonate transport system substrate-binding protein